MSLTDDEALADFFRRRIVPLHKRLPRTVLARPAETKSSFIELKRQRDGISTLRLVDEAKVIRALQRQWYGTPLAALAEPLLRLTPRFRRVEESRDVSPFIYEMF